MIIWSRRITISMVSIIGTLYLPHSITDSGGQPEEIVSFTYESITQEHCIAGTSAYSLWEDRLF